MSMHLTSGLSCGMDTAISLFLDYLGLQSGAPFQLLPLGPSAAWPQAALLLLIQFSWTNIHGHFSHIKP
jgi:hypothetical protein